MHTKLLKYYWGTSIYVYVTGILNIKNRSQYSTLEGLFINRKKNNTWRSGSFDADNDDVPK